MVHIFFSRSCNFSPLSAFARNNQRLLSTERDFICNQFLRVSQNHLTKSLGNRIVNKLNNGLSSHEPFQPEAPSHSSISKFLSQPKKHRVKAANDYSKQENVQTVSKLPFKVDLKSPRVTPNIKSILRYNLKNNVQPYVNLTKPNLTILVTISSICSYAISPYSASLLKLFLLTVGTALCSSSANAINMGREPEFDSKMPRTVGRPVVRGLITPSQAYKFALLTGVMGLATLFFGVNRTVALLGLTNIIIYSWIYTSLKRKSIINTWIGAIVGAIPPLMGWAVSSSLVDPGAWCLAALLYSWQFPHFNSLSHNLAKQYKDAGYVMTAAEYPKLNARVALRYSFLMIPLCFGLSYYKITDWFFCVDSLIPNILLVFLAYKFWNQQKRNYNSVSKPSSTAISMANMHAKNLFWVSVWHLPSILILAMVHKKGQWEALFLYLGL